MSVKGFELDKYEMIVMANTINTREMIIWFRSEEEFDTTKYFWCNQTMADKLGLERNEQGLIFTKDYYELFVMDDEGNAFIEDLKRASKKVRENVDNSSESYVVKVRNKKTGNLVYLHYILDVFERYPDGRVKTWGGNGIDVTDVYVNGNNNYIIEGIGGGQYNLMTNKIKKGQKEAELNPIESRIFLLLVEANGGLVTYEKMKQYMDYQSVSSVMEFAKVYVHRIRKKLERIGCKEVKIISHYAKGYSLRVVSEE